MRFGHLLLFMLSFVAYSAAESRSQVALGQLQTGATVIFTRSAASDWGLEISGGPTPPIAQSKPSRVEVSPTEEETHELATGYKTVAKSAGGIDAVAEIPYGNKVVFRVQDHWSLRESVLAMRRNVEVVGDAPGGFGSSVVLETDSAVPWTSLTYMIPGILYGDPTHNGERSPGGTLNNAARHYQVREDLAFTPNFFCRKTWVPIGSNKVPQAYFWPQMSCRRWP